MTIKPAITKPRLRSGLIRYLILSCISLSATQMLFAQTTSVAMPSRNTTAQAIVQEIENQTGYKITVNWENLNPNRAVVLSDTTLSAEEALNQMLSGTGYTWESIHGRIVIGKATVPDNGANAISAIMRDDFNQENLRFVPDPWSHTQQPFNNMVNTRVVRMSEENGRDSTGMVMVNFRVNSSTVERDYMNNARALATLNRTFQDREILSSLDYMVITAGSSPEGQESVNEELATKRALALKSYIMWKFPFMNRDIIYTFSIGENWTGLQSLVENDPNTPNQEEVLSLLESTQSNSSKKAALKTIDGGRAWTYIVQKMLPKLRGGAALSLHTKVNQIDTVIVEKVKEVIIRDTVYVDRIIEPQPVVPVVIKEPVKKPLFAVKTNLLMDLGTAINIEAEVPIGKRWSVAGEWIFPWWLIENDQIALQTGVATLEVRSYLGNREGRQPLTGWFLGAHGGWGYYDLEWRDEGYQGELWYTGLSGGYAHTINRSGSLRMEYSLGVGYMHTGYTTYTPQQDSNGDWHLMRRKEAYRDYIGPTRAKVSLVWMLNRNSKQKGGAQ
jgi:hypothetical protein